MSRKGRDLVLGLIDEVSLYLHDTFFFLLEVDFNQDHECLHELLFSEICKIHLHELARQNRLTPMQEDYLVKSIHGFIHKHMYLIEDNGHVLDSELELRSYLLAFHKPEMPNHRPSQLCILGTLSPVPWMNLREEDKFYIRDFVFNTWTKAGDPQTPIEFAEGDERMIATYRLKTPSSMQDVPSASSAAAE